MLYDILTVTMGVLLAIHIIFAFLGIIGTMRSVGFSLTGITACICIFFVALPLAIFFWSRSGKLVIDEIQKGSKKTAETENKVFEFKM